MADSPTFASFLTPNGIIVAAGIVVTLVQLLKGTFPALNDHVSGAILAFVFSLILYVATLAAVGVSSPDEVLTAFTSWLACALSAVGTYATVRHVQDIRQS